MAQSAEKAAGPRVVIIGAGFGGLYAARAFKDAAVDLTIIDRRNYHLFQPLLYQVATAGLSPGDIAYPIRAILRKQENARVLLAEVKSIDLDSRAVVLDDERIPYDFLILASGATSNYFGHSEWEHQAPGLTSLENALEIRKRILLAFEEAEREPDETTRRGWLTFVVIGGGPTGVEMAGAIAEIAFKVMADDFRSINPREARILLVEAGPRLLPAFPEDLAAKAEAELKRIGVDVRTGVAISSIHDGLVRFGESEVRSATVIWGAGVRPSPLTQSLDVAKDRAGRVVVEPDLSIPGHPEVFVVGDAAAFSHQTGKPLAGVAPVAIQEGRHAAQNVIRKIGGAEYAPFHYIDYGNLATIGRAYAIADLGWLHLSGFLAWVTWLLVHIFRLIGFRNRVVVFFEWAWAYFSFQRAARLITGHFE